MKLNEIPAWLGGDNLKAIAKGAAAAVKGVAMGATKTTGLQGKNWLTGSTNPANTFAQDFVQRIGKKIRNAVGAGNVDVDPAAPPKTTGKDWEWSALGRTGSGYFKSGNTGVVFKRTPAAGGVGSWEQVAPPAAFGTDTSQARALEQKWTKFQQEVNDNAAGDMPDLTESRYLRLNALFERILQEAEPKKHSIASMLQQLVKIDVGTSAPLDPTEEAAIGKQCLVAQRSYNDAAKFNKELFNLGKLLYSFVSKKPTP